MKLRWAVVAGLGSAAVLVAFVIADRQPLRSEYCVAKTDTMTARVDLEQARWTALMAAIAQRQSLPPRATTIAIATAYQESKIRNIEYGDRDSLGLFQQRPSQGWGTPEQIMNPNYSIAKFYRALADVPQYSTRPVTDAAQRVQKSAYPDAYADHEQYARALASTLRGYSPAQFNCVVNPVAPGSASAAARSVRAAFAKPATVNNDDIEVRLDRNVAGYRARGWAVSHYLVANAQRLGLSSVRFDRKVWSAETSDQGWQNDPQAPRHTVVASTND